MSTAKKRLGILQAGHAPEELQDEFKDYDAMFPSLLGLQAFDYINWPVVDGILPDSIAEADAWLITGSRHGAYEDHAWIPPLESLIRDAYAAGQPMVGICFGHQIIAQALGGKVEKFSGGWSVGRVEYQMHESLFSPQSTAPNTSPSTSQIKPPENDSHKAIDNQPAGNSAAQRTVPLMAFHQDQVTEPPAGAVTVGSTDFCEHAVLLYDDRILSLQPHPEFSGDFVNGLIQIRGKILPAEVCEKASTSLDQHISQDSIATVLREFLQRSVDS